MSIRHSPPNCIAFERERFRNNSVADRPGDWGLLYDQILDDVSKNGDLLVIQSIQDVEAYAKVNRVILDEAISLGLQLHEKVTAVLVWDGKASGGGDLTADFGMRAREKALPIIEVMTVDAPRKGLKADVNPWTDQLCDLRSIVNRVSV